jgi:hypothetical protein
LGVNERFEFSLGRVHNKSGPPKSIVLARFLRNSSRIKRLVLSPIPESLKNEAKLKLRDLNVDVPPRMSAAIRRKLVDEFRGDIVRLEELVGRDLSEWYKEP